MRATTAAALLLLAAALAPAGAALAQQQPQQQQQQHQQQHQQSAPPAAFDPAARAEAQRAPAPGAPTTKEEVQIYVDEPGPIVGRVSIPDDKLRVLVQPEGREWREFKAFLLKIVAGVAILGMVGILALFYLWRGKILIRHGRSGLTVRRFNGLERTAHWLTSVSFLVLAVTGLAVTFGRPLLIPLIGHEAFTAVAQASKYGHNFFSVPFVVGLVLILGLWIRDNIPEKADLEWIRQGGGFLKGGGVHPEAGRFNAGQKMIFWSVVGGGALLAVSGYLLMAPFYVTGVGGMQVAHVVHAVLAAILTAIIIGHIYIGTVGMEGAFDAMGSGEVDENWAREHHSRWYEEATGRTASYEEPPRGALAPGRSFAE
jgi:formate dehydrogenase subunit gamma